MKGTPDRAFMEMAIREARKNLRTLDGGPFGACIIREGTVLAVARNTVLRNDATAHAEVNAVRKACRRLGRYDLSGSIIYSTTEPCPMCFSAVHWARIGTIVYGTNIADARRAGFHELEISNRRLKTLGRSPIAIIGDFLRPECLELFEAWGVLPGKRLY
jgi:tRNA(Arg) A34 adenosine deaminase TadA